MTYEDLRVAIADGIAELTLDRPSERNAFSGPMAASLARAYRTPPRALGARRAPRLAGNDLTI